MTLDLQTDTAFLRAAVQGGVLGRRTAVPAPLAHKLVDRRHSCLPSPGTWNRRGGEVDSKAEKSRYYPPGQGQGKSEIRKSETSLNARNSRAQNAPWMLESWHPNVRDFGFVSGFRISCCSDLRSSACGPCQQGPIVLVESLYLRRSAARAARFSRTRPQDTALSLRAAKIRLIARERLVRRVRLVAGVTQRHRRRSDQRKVGDS